MKQSKWIINNKQWSNKTYFSAVAEILSPGNTRHLPLVTLKDEWLPLRHISLPHVKVLARSCSDIIAVWRHADLDIIARAGEIAATKSLDRVAQGCYVVHVNIVVGAQCIQCAAVRRKGHWCHSVCSSGCRRVVGGLKWWRVVVLEVSAMFAHIPVLDRSINCTWYICQTRCDSWFEIYKCRSLSTYPSSDPVEAITCSLWTMYCTAEAVLGPSLPCLDFLGGAARVVLAWTFRSLSAGL